ncbi:MAG: hypothetical protein ABS944_18315 [Solibacillus sp.]|uniref:hypothetical protein n=1 Tax=Solibacillus sp. TaxID=1909654 RepID=UPI00331540FB
MRTIQSELERNQLTKKHDKASVKKEKFTRREIEQLMGVNRDIFKRVNGAIRRK